MPTISTYEARLFSAGSSFLRLVLAVLVPLIAPRIT
jgi:hypothetical protein